MIKAVNKQNKADISPRQTELHPAILFAGWSWIILLFILIMVNAVQANYWAGDDVSWMNFVSRGMKSIWTEPSLYGHYRPFFGTYLWVFQTLGLDHPIPMTMAGIILVVLSFYFAFRLFGVWLDKNAAFIAAVLLTVHPLREPHLFWLSAQIDSWCLLLSLACLFFALKFRTEKGRNMSAIILIPGLTLFACMCKEIALLLPLLVFILPGQCQFHRRISAAVLSGLGAVLYALSTLILFTRKANFIFLVKGFDLKKLLNYPHQLFWPTDLSELVMKARLNSEYLPLLLLVFYVLIMVLFLGWVCLHFRKENWVLAGIILLLAGAAVCIFDSDHRGLGLGCAGIAIILVGVAIRLQPKKKILFSLLAVNMLAVSWLPCWLQYHYAWRDAKIFSRILTENIRDTRSRIGSSYFFVTLGTPLSIKGSVWPSYVEELDGCSISLVQVKVAQGSGKLQVEKVQNGRYRLQSPDGCPFSSVSHSYEGSGVVKAFLSERKYVFSLLFDPQLFNWFHSDCEKIPYFLYWNGNKIVPLNSE